MSDLYHCNKPFSPIPLVRPFDNWRNWLWLLVTENIEPHFGRFSPVHYSNAPKELKQP